MTKTTYILLSLILDEICFECILNALEKPSIISKTGSFLEYDINIQKENNQEINLSNMATDEYGSVQRNTFRFRTQSDVRNGEGRSHLNGNGIELKSAQRNEFNNAQGNEFNNVQSAPRNSRALIESHSPQFAFEQVLENNPRPQMQSFPNHLPTCDISSTKFKIIQDKFQTPGNGDTGTNDFELQLKLINQKFGGNPTKCSYLVDQTYQLSGAGNNLLLGNLDQKSPVPQHSSTRNGVHAPEFNSLPYNNLCTSTTSNGQVIIDNIQENELSNNCKNFRYVSSTSQSKGKVNKKSKKMHFSCICLHCSQKISATNYAPHLQKCMIGSGGSHTGRERRK